MFVGVHDRQLDDKHRLALPATFRAELSERCYLELDGEGCIVLRQPDDFEQHARELIEAQKRGELSRSRRRAVATYFVAASIDKQGRVTLDEKLREHAGLSGGAPVTVVGMWDAIEIWRPTRFDAVRAEGEHEAPRRDWSDEA